MTIIHHTRTDNCKWCGAIDIKKFGVTPARAVSCLTVFCKRIPHFCKTFSPAAGGEN